MDPCSSDVRAVAAGAGGAAGREAGVRASAELRGLVDGKVDLDGTGQVSLRNLAQDARLAMSGGNVAVVGDSSVYAGAIQQGAVTDDKVPGRELTGARLNATAGIGEGLVARSDTILDVRRAIGFTDNDFSRHNTVAGVSSDTAAATPGAGDTGVVVMVPILRAPALVNARVTISPRPKLLLRGTGRMDTRVRVSVWDANTGKGITDRALDCRMASYDDLSASVVCSGSNPAGNRWLVVQWPTDPSEQGTAFRVTLAAVADRWLGGENSHGIQIDMVKPACLPRAVGLFGPVTTGTLASIDGTTATWTVTGGKRNGVSTFGGITAMVGSDMGRLTIQTDCDKPLNISPIVLDTSGKLHEPPMGVNVPAGRHDTRLDLDEISAHAGAPLDRIWITGTEDGDYHLTATIDIQDQWADDGDLRGTLQRLEALATKPVPEQLLTSPDGAKWRITIGNDGTPAIQALSKTITRVRVLGNSLTTGMAASDPEHDWVSLLAGKLHGINPGVTYHCWDDGDKTGDTVTTSSGYGFEVDATQARADAFAATLHGDEDLVLIQLGDNVNNDQRRAAFRSQVGPLARAIRAKARGAVVMFVSGWFDQPSLNPAIDDAMAGVGGWHLTIGDLNTKDNQASMGATVTWPDRTTHTIDDPSLARHPGDKGMQAIVDRIWQTLGPIAKTTTRE
ncbi:SGNH/GDSL hydrolase family protein [Bifidobacterium sp. ESL0775]|uniref:SGNH/GDSL hydrolase family protein n=1 Tax=Bifidobacterium sp. ESL0775 TaxID=2983230 RepID=UPI0023F78DF9|nr:SGNH/GDSL hydrolase family protein [Bifidobacterium sp. ESL0775]WEV68709.1 SGNH/GDSL hydrolase family protein [Bifidobacterium sp. ESL0775]